MNYIDGTLSTNNLIIKSCYDVSNVSKCIKKVEECLGVVYSQLIDHKVLETRGMWYYPFSYPTAYDDTTLEGVINTLDIFKEMGFGGFHMHTRAGMSTEYLSDEFMDMVKACVNKAKSEDMFAYLYDEDRWPSGSAGGIVSQNPEFVMRNLLFTTKPYSPDFKQTAVNVTGRGGTREEKGGGARCQGTGDR